MCPNLTLDMVSQTEQKSTNPWISVLYVLTYGNLILDVVSLTEQKSTNPWISVKSDVYCT
jgi:hypothetical protein